MSYILGPWEWKHGSVRPQYDEDTRPVAYIPMWEDNHQLREDRGHLIAASPDLLEACEADAILWQHYTRCLECAGTRFCTDAMELAATASSKRAIAIAKAKGENNE